MKALRITCRISTKKNTNLDAYSEVYFLALCVWGAGGGA